MLPTFRLMLVATVVVIVVLMVAARGLVAYPDAVTRIGEVPTVSRSLLQISAIPTDATQHRLRLAANPLPASDADGAGEVGAGEVGAGEVGAGGVGAIAAATATTSGTAADGPAVPPLPLVAADDRGRQVATPRSADPLGDLIRAVVPETPEPAPRDPGVAVGPVAAVETTADDTVQRLGFGAGVRASAPAMTAPMEEPVPLGFAAAPAAPPSLVAPPAPEVTDAAVAVVAPAAAAAQAATPVAKPIDKPAAKTGTKSKRAGKPAPRKKPKPRVVYRPAPAPVATATPGATHDLIFPTYGPFGTTTAPTTGTYRR
ncbi:hypothetical protein [Rhodoplanes sp. SY1]|uniref:hypothetical protein n=1 Tax=Rhodoplanes sp. SY1 TaxID=3166646 RepID=UPI0038B65B4C